VVIEDDTPSRCCRSYTDPRVVTFDRVYVILSLIYHRHIFTFSFIKMETRISALMMSET